MYPSQTEDSDNLGIKSTKKHHLKVQWERKKQVFATLRTLA